MSPLIDVFAVTRLKKRIITKLKIKAKAAKAKTTPSALKYGLGPKIASQELYSA